VIATVDRSIPIAVVAPTGRVDAVTAPLLRARCDALLADGTTRLVIDLSDVEFLDSAGLAAMVGALKRARAAGGDVRLVAPETPAVRRILELTRFDRVFDLAPDADTAVARFATSNGRSAGR
jgi:anti-sigma B factor antagonist